MTTDFTDNADDFERAEQTLDHGIRDIRVNGGQFS
jgi:hypothetical protein